MRTGRELLSRQYSHPARPRPAAQTVKTHITPDTFSGNTRAMYRGAPACPLRRHGPAPALRRPWVPACRHEAGRLLGRQIRGRYTPAAIRAGERPDPAPGFLGPPPGRGHGGAALLAPLPGLPKSDALIIGWLPFPPQPAFSPTRTTNVSAPRTGPCRTSPFRAPPRRGLRRCADPAPGRLLVPAGPAGEGTGRLQGHGTGCKAGNAAPRICSPREAIRFTGGCSICASRGRALITRVGAGIGLPS